MRPGRRRDLAWAAALALSGCGRGATAIAVSSDAAAIADGPAPPGGCLCSSDGEWSVTSLACFCTWFRCPPNLEAALSEPRECRGAQSRAALLTYADCRRIVFWAGEDDGPSRGWTFDADSHALIGAYRSAWPTSFQPPVCGDAGYIRTIRVNPPSDAACTQTASQNLCAADAGADSGLDGG